MIVFEAWSVWLWCSHSSLFPPADQDHFHCDSDTCTAVELSSVKARQQQTQLQQLYNLIMVLLLWSKLSTALCVCVCGRGGHRGISGRIWMDCQNIHLSVLMGNPTWYFNYFFQSVVYVGKHYYCRILVSNICKSSLYIISIQLPNPFKVIWSLTSQCMSPVTFPYK